ncbi:MAG: DUF6161 domain-containing protein [Burkholderiaceae bacterium]
MAEEEEGAAFEFTASDGQRFAFRDRDDAVEFAKTERRHWDWVGRTAVLREFNGPLRSLTRIVPSLDEVVGVPPLSVLHHESGITREGFDQRVFNSLTAYFASKPAVHSRAQLQRHLERIADRDPAEAAWTLGWLAYLEGEASQVPGFLRNNIGADGFLTGLASAWQWAGRLLAHSQSESLVDAAQQAAQRAAILGDRADAAANTAETAAKAVHEHVAAARLSVEGSQHWVNDFKAKTEAKLREIADEKRDDLDVKWKELSRTYSEQLKLKAPSEYWGKKRTQHRNLSLGFATASAAFAGFAGWRLCAYYGSLPQGAPGSVPPLTELLPSAVAAIVFLWVLRTLMRLTMSHVHLSLDAAEREVMVQCYLAMTHEGETTGDERGALFAAIFRPTGDGLVKDETPPIPMWEMLKAAKPKAD